MTIHVPPRPSLVIALAGAALAIVCGGPGSPPPQNAAQSAGTPQAASSAAPPAAGAVTPQATGAPAVIEPACQMACSPDKPRTAVASISWSVAQPVTDPQALSAGVTQQSLDVTTFKDGFQRGAFAQLTPGVNRTFAFRAAPAQPSNLPGLTGLSVTRVATLQDRIATRPGADRELMPPAANNDPNRVVVVEIQGLEPGLNYYWRRSPEGPVVRCQAPICPSDSRGRR